MFALRLQLQFTGLPTAHDSIKRLSRSTSVYTFQSWVVNMETEISRRNLKTPYTPARTWNWARNNPINNKDLRELQPKSKQPCQIRESLTRTLNNRFNTLRSPTKALAEGRGPWNLNLLLRARIKASTVCWCAQTVYLLLLLSSWVDTLYTFGDNITYYKTKSLHCLGPMNSATKTFCLHMALFVYVSSCVTSDRYMYFRAY